MYKNQIKLFNPNFLSVSTTFRVHSCWIHVALIYFHWIRHILHSFQFRRKLKLFSNSSFLFSLTQKSWGNWKLSRVEWYSFANSKLAAQHNTIQQIRIYGIGIQYKWNEMVSVKFEPLILFQSESCAVVVHVHLWNKSSRAFAYAYS